MTSVMASRVEQIGQRDISTRYCVHFSFQNVDFQRRTRLTERTRQLQSQFDKVLTNVWKCCQDDLEFVKNRLLPCMPRKIMKHLKETPSVNEVFLWISVYAKWFQYDLLKEIVYQLGDVKCTELLFGYEAKLKCYFEARVRPLREMDTYVSSVKCSVDNNDQRDNNSETFVVEVDDAWDQEVLLGENCVETCRQIGSIFGKRGKICGAFHDPYLHIHVLHSNTMQL